MAKVSKVVKTFRLSAADFRELSEYSEAHEVSVSSFVEDLIKGFLSRKHKEDRMPGWKVVEILVEEDVANMMSFRLSQEGINDCLRAKLNMAPKESVAPAPVEDPPYEATSEQAHKEEPKAEVSFEQLSQEEQLKQFKF